MMRIVFLAAVVLTCLTGLPALAQQDFLSFQPGPESETRVSRISVEGAQRVDPSTIVSYMDIKPGDLYTQTALSNSLKNLYATGLFADVNLRQNGPELIVMVVENPVINRVAFEGNDKIDDTELAAEITSRPRSVYIRNAVRSDVDRIQELYRRNGRYSVEVNPQIIRLDQNRIDLVFEITEGPVSEITGIQFIGNEVFFR